MRHGMRELAGSGGKGCNKRSVWNSQGRGRLWSVGEQRLQAAASGGKRLEGAGRGGKRCNKRTVRNSQGREVVVKGWIAGRKAGGREAARRRAKKSGSGAGKRAGKQAGKPANDEQRQREAFWKAA
ncbi:hypothetical protein B0H14DRAFT_3140214 [Mycena olivaceomarginata]|nr:hypothetical protein B0H14DRAFT_3140214 [Mycena olivaceomarginata]